MIIPSECIFAQQGPRSCISCAVDVARWEKTWRIRIQLRPAIGRLSCGMKILAPRRRISVLRGLDIRIRTWPSTRMQMLGLRYVLIIVAESFTYCLVSTTVSISACARRGHLRDFISKFLLHSPRYCTMDSIGNFFNVFKVF